jgi:hypothetical protein
MKNIMTAVIFLALIYVCGGAAVSAAIDEATARQERVATLLR